MGKSFVSALMGIIVSEGYVENIDDPLGRLYLNEGCYEGEQILAKDWVKASMDVSTEYSRPGANDDPYNAIGYGYQWWIPEGNEGEFMSEGYELKHVEFFRAIAKEIS